MPENDHLHPDRKYQTLCPEHGWGVSVDEDGCCGGCGSGAYGAGVDAVAHQVAGLERKLEVALGRVAALQETSDLLDRQVVTLKRKVHRTPRWQCFQCGLVVWGNVGDCKGYCQDPTGNSCSAKPCPNCGKVHYWTGGVNELRVVKFRTLFLDRVHSQNLIHQVFSVPLSMLES